MSKQKENGLLPTLRFPEFREAGEWDAKELKDACQMQAGKFVSASKIQEHKNSELYPCYGGNGLRGYTKSFTHEGKYSLIGRQGALCGNVTHVNGKFHATEHAVVATPKNNVNTDWLFYELNLLNLNRYATGQAQPGLSIENLEKVRIKIPRFKDEQKKIADFLTSVDELLIAQTQKLDALKTHKKGLIQQLFPADGETVPKRRFPEFEDAGDWKIKSFDELFTIGNGRDYKHLSSGDVPVYGSGGYMLSVNDYLYDGESVCIGRKGTINNPMFLTGKFWTVDTLFYTHSFDGCLPRFIYAIFQKINWLKHNEAGGVPSLSKTNIGKIKVAVPKIPEQQKIADCLASIDEMIISQSQKLQSLNVYKKGLMQQLFPAMDEVSA